MKDNTFLDSNEVMRVTLPPGHVYLVKLIRGGWVSTGLASAVEERENGVLLKGRCVVRCLPHGRVEVLPLPDQTYRKGQYGYFAYAIPRPAWWPKAD
jgi:hypothetical protein